MVLPIKGYRETILEYYNQVDIYSHYLHIPPEDIVDILEKKRYISNPLRIDHNPSLTFVMKEDKLRMMDCARREFRGDVFDIVGLLIGENCNSKEGFVIICKEILKKVKPFTSVPEGVVNEIMTAPASRTKSKKQSKIMEPSIRDWLRIDRLYWGDHHVDINFLKHEYIKPLKEARINDYLYYSMTPGNPGYSYFYGRIEDRILQKWYFPYEIKSRKFRTNTKYPFENITDIGTNKYLWLAKSSKDRLVTKSLLRKLRTDNIIGELVPFFDIVSISSESARFKDSTVAALRKRYDYILMTIDDDETGEHTKEFYKDSGITVKFLPSCSTKDISDYARANSLKSSKEFIKEYLIQWLRSEVRLSL